jgi:hypothetical protein
MLEPVFEKRINSAKKVADRLERALQRDANPPMKRVKTAAMWGAAILAIGAGSLLQDNRGYLRFRMSCEIPKPRQVGLDIPPAEIVFPPNRSDAIVIPGLLGVYELGTGPFSRCRFRMQTPYLNQMVFFINLTTEGLFDPNTLAECDVVHFVRVRDTPSNDPVLQGGCGPDRIRFLVIYRRYKIMKNPTMIVPTDEQLLAQGEICVSLADIQNGYGFEFDCDKDHRLAGISLSGQSFSLPEAVQRKVKGPFGFILQNEVVFLSSPTVERR